MSAVSEAGTYRLCLVVAHTDAGYAADTCRRFRRLGWDVYQAHSGPEARRLARMLEADLIVLDANLAEESGWLTCAKLMHERPGCQVAVVCAEVDPRSREMAALVGATVVTRQQGLAGLIQASWPRPASAAG